MSALAAVLAAVSVAALLTGQTTTAIVTGLGAAAASVAFHARRKPTPEPINRDVVRHLIKLGMAETDAADRDIDSPEFDAAKATFERAFRAAAPADQAAAHEALRRHGY